MNNAMDFGFEECDVLILGAGLGGLAAARALGSCALVLERELRPGGLVRSEEHNDYIFDHTLHILLPGPQLTVKGLFSIILNLTGYNR